MIGQIVRARIPKVDDAVGPGWGHTLPNNRSVPKRAKTSASPIHWSDPPTPAIMSVLVGHKIAAYIFAPTAKVPSILWSGSFGSDNDGRLQAKP
jgi:acetyl-CoA carboxylase / biotin carboxylase 1